MSTTVEFERRNTSRRKSAVYWFGIAACLLLAMASYIAVAATYAGTFSGTFSGDDSGNWSATIDANGLVAGSGYSSSAGQSFSMTGTVTSAGVLTMGSASVGASFSGTISSTGAVTGNWSNPNFGESGKFSGAGTVPVVPTTSPSFISNERVFKFAEANSNLFSGVSTSGTFEIYTYRYYPATGHYLALDPSNVIYLMGPSTDDTIQTLGAASSFASQITQWEASQSASNSSSTGGTSPNAGFALTGHKHEYLKSRFRIAAWQGRINTYRHNADGTRGSFFSSTAESCGIQVDQDGHMTWTSGDSSITYRYEKLDGIDPSVAGRVRLYALNTTTNQPFSSLEFIDDSAIVRKVSEGSNTILEDECVIAGNYDLAIANRFPNVDGRLGGDVGTYTGEVTLVLSDSSPKTVQPAGLVIGAACTADINPLGQVQVTIAGVKLPVFGTTDLNYSTNAAGWGIMFSGNALVNPQTTYALEYSRPSYNEIARAMSFGFMVYLAPLTYLNWAIPPLGGDWSAMCVTTKKP